jgi:hypothetical protein
MKALIQELRRSFEFIVIDSPPVIGISDAAVLSVLSDGVLLVLNGQRTSTTTAQKAVERLDMVRARLLGVVLNGVNLNDPNYSYFRSYEPYYTYRSESEHEGVDSNGNGSIHGHTEKRGHGRPATSMEGGLKNQNYEDRKENSTPDIERDRHIAESGATESVHSSADELLADASSIRIQPVVIHGSVNKVIEALSMAMGPIAVTIVQEHIAALGESRYAFPENRIDELLKSLQGAITADELKAFSRHFFGKDLDTLDG